MTVASKKEQTATVKVTRPAERRLGPIQRTDRLMTMAEVSDLLGIPVSTLYGWRHRGEGPAGYRIGRYVRYRRAEVEAWIEARAEELLDFVGLDVAVAIADGLHRDSGAAEHEAPELLRRLVADGKLGRKSGAGFYEY
jgi:excisionase family DNA binding protein